MKSCWTLLLIIIFGLQLLRLEAQGQSPYVIKIGPDIAYTAISAGLAFSGTVLDLRSDPMTEQEILSLNPSDVNGLDRHVTRNWDPVAKKASDIFLLSSMALPAALLVIPKTRRDLPKIVLLGLQAALLNQGMTFLTKTSFGRVRPFLYNSSVPLKQKRSRGTRQSFFSGHASYSAVFSFFTAQVIHDFFPEASWRRWVWAGAALIPATTSYLRVRSGKHFITDVAVGYLIGAGAGLLIPLLHRPRIAKTGLSFQVGAGNFVLGYRF